MPRMANGRLSTITFVSGFPGGAATDIYARKLGTELNKRLHTGADLRESGLAPVATSRPNIVAQRQAGRRDTFLLGTAGTHAINPALYKKLPFDPMKDFSRIALLGALPNVLLVNRSEKHPDVKTCQDLVALARKKPGALNYASTGNGASGHLAAVQFGGRRAEPLPPTSRTAGKARPCHGVAGRRRRLLLQPDVAEHPGDPVGQGARSWPSPRRSGSPRCRTCPRWPKRATSKGFESTTWYGLFGPAGLPPDHAEAHVRRRAQRRSAH
jgi:hypothetical protein